MNNEGFGTNGAPFEYTVEKKGKQRRNRKILFFLAYAVYVVVVFGVGVWSKLLVPALCFIPLSVWIISYFTWRYTNEEIKLTFFGGAMTVTRQFDGKNPKKILETKIKDIKSFVPYTPEAAQSLKKDSTVYAVQTEKCEDAYIMTLENNVIVMEANEKAMKIIKYYNNSLFEV